MDSVEIVNTASIPSVILENKNTTSSEYIFTISEEVKVTDFLAYQCQKSKLQIKKALNKGAVWLKRKTSKQRRIRKATFTLLPGDTISLFYDRKILSSIPPSPQLLAEEKHYSLWFKPAQLLSQGTKYGDHCSLLRIVSLYYNNKKDIKLIHRLDREAYGLILLANTKQGAREMSRLFKNGKVEKRYRAVVRGEVGKTGDTLTLTDPLDGKEASTTVTVLSNMSESNTSQIDIGLHTGRFHQIRRHLSMAGHPLVGDYRYGSTRKSEKELQLCAYKLCFQCPFTKDRKEYTL